MWIVIEGPDLAGKTTLADNLEKSAIDVGTTVLRGHARPPKHHPLDEYVRPRLGYRPGQPQSIIDDRWHWGEAIYPQVLDRPTDMNVGVFLYIEMFMRSRGALMVSLNPQPSVLRERLRDRGDDLVNDTHMRELWLLYNQIRTSSIVTHLNGLKHDAESIIDEAIAAAIYAMDVTPYATYVGSPKPKILFVGDQRARTDMVLAPAFMPYPATSGRYLLNALATAGPRQWRKSIGLMNACDIDDISAAYTAMNEPHVVALGANAHQKLTQHHIPHSRVPHPQYIRRFYHREQIAYGTLLYHASQSREDFSSWRP